MKRSLGVLDRTVVVERARAAIAKPIRYQLGQGGRDPRSASPGDACDCSGFVAWCLGVDRYLPNAGIPHMQDGAWWECTAVWRDARSPYGVVAEVDWDMASPGDVVVYPDRGSKQGHIGIVAEVGIDGPTSVIHCSLGNDKQLGHAVAETAPTVFKHGGAIVGRVAWVR